MKNKKTTGKWILKTKKTEVKKNKPVKPNNDFLTSGAQNFYVTKNSIVAQRVLSIDRNGNPVAVKNEYYAKTPAREEAMKRSGINPGKAIKGKGASSRQTIFWR